jgi:hypothetical protein
VSRRSAVQTLRPRGAHCEIVFLWRGIGIGKADIKALMFSLSLDCNLIHAPRLRGGRRKTADGAGVESLPILRQSISFPRLGSARYYRRDFAKRTKFAKRNPTDSL